MSETRNILDTLGNVIGALTLPDGTSESIWTQQLAEYSTVVVNVPRTDVTTLTTNATSTITNSTSTLATLLTLNPPAGTYLADFNGSVNTGGASATGEFGIYINGSLLTETKRPISCNLQLLGGLVSISLNNIAVGTNTATEVTLDGTQTVDVKFKSTNGGQIGFAERVLTLLKVR